MTTQPTNWPTDEPTNVFDFSPDDPLRQALRVHGGRDVVRLEGHEGHARRLREEAERHLPPQRGEVRGDFGVRGECLEKRNGSFFFVFCVARFTEQHYT